METCSAELDVLEKNMRELIDDYIVEVDKVLKKQDKLLAACGVHSPGIKTEQ